MFILFIQLLLSVAHAAPVTYKQEDVYVPFYDPTANGHSTGARGWNTFGLQANGPVAQAAGFAFDDSK